MTNGATTGWYVDNADVNHGFVRDRQGAIVEFDVPGAGFPRVEPLLRTAR